MVHGQWRKRYGSGMSIFLPAGARVARERLVLRLLYVFRVCLFVCLFVRPHLSRAQYITSYVTMQLQYSSVWRFAGQATANEGSFVLPRWRKRGR